MDGNVVIGVELRDRGFTQGLAALRQAAEQTAVRGLGNLNASLGSLSAAFSRVAHGAATLVPQLYTLGQSAGRQLIYGFSQGDYYGTGAGAGRMLLYGLMAGGSGMAGWAYGMRSSIQSAFQGGWYSVGSSIAYGIAEGIWDGSSYIRWAAVSAAQNALSAAKRALGIRSPSRVFREEVGQMIPQGIAAGISDGAPVAQQAVEESSRALVTAARRDVTPRTTVQRTGSHAGDSAVFGGVTVRLEAPLYLDGRELARATARYTGQQMEWEAMG